MAAAEEPGDNVTPGTHIAGGETVEQAAVLGTAPVDKGGMGALVVAMPPGVVVGVAWVAPLGSRA